MHFVYFVGRFHVLLLHLPITLVLVVALLEWLTRGGRRRDLAACLSLLWSLTALTAVLTAALGYMHYSEGSFTGPSAAAHRALGTSVAIVAVLGAWLRTRPAGAAKLAPALAAALVILVTLTGHYGGNLTHGSEFLTQYAPDPLRQLLGLERQRPPVTDIAKADPYLDVVRPMLVTGCGSCHNADKQRGGLDLGRYAATMRGGKAGAVIVKGNANGSDLMRRVTLSPGQDDFMPKEGKTPLTDAQVAILQWWIDAGAATGVTVADLKASPAVLALLTAQVHRGTAGAPPAVARSVNESAADAANQPEQKPDAKFLKLLADANFMARPVSLSDPRLIVSPIAPGAHYTAAQVAVLGQAASVIVDLDLRNAGLGDDMIAPLQQLGALEHLRLDRNALNDHSVGQLATLGKLTSLSLYGNQGVTDASIEGIARMASLQKIYLWQTGVTPAGVQKLKQLKPALFIDSGDMLAPPPPPAEPAAAPKP
jgi:uncharacterized membrane protein